MAKNILIVEDNVHLREVLAKIIQHHGYEISEASSGSQAIETAKSVKPHLILLDLDLPDMTGMEAARAIRRNNKTAHIPIVVCSASMGVEFKEAAARAGAVDYLIKPISADVIKATIDRFVLFEH
jgi:CheY-like chemotaxis protein